MSDRHISGAVMFGRGNFQPGVLGQPSPEYAFNPKDMKRLADYRSLIWLVVLFQVAFFHANKNYKTGNQ